MNRFNIIPPLPLGEPSPLLKSPGIRFIPYLAFGVFVFWFTSVSDLNDFVRGYLLILQIQGGLLLLYLLMYKLKK